MTRTEIPTIPESEQRAMMRAIEIEFYWLRDCGTNPGLWERI